MGPLTVVTGLLGSGKSTLIAEIVQETGAAHVDHFLTDNDGTMAGHPGFRWEKCQSVVESLRVGKAVVVEEIGFCCQQNRDVFMNRINQYMPGIRPIWKFFENDVTKADANVRRRASATAANELEINSRLSLVYTIPPDAEPIQIWQPGRPT
jgi:hypothetical protein